MVVRVLPHFLSEPLDKMCHSDNKSAETPPSLWDAMLYKRHQGFLQEYIPPLVYLRARAISPFLSM